jgi:acetyl-CoA synthetase
LPAPEDIGVCMVAAFEGVVSRGRRPELAKEISTHVRKVLGPVAYPDKVYFVKDVPKTRSGKIMRRVIKAKALGKETGDLSALANPESVENIPRIDL